MSDIWFIIDDLFCQSASSHGAVYYVKTQYVWVCDDWHQGSNLVICSWWQAHHCREWCVMMITDFREDVDSQHQKASLENYCKLNTEREVTSFSSLVRCNSSKNTHRNCEVKPGEMCPSCASVVWNFIKIMLRGALCASNHLSCCLSPHAAASGEVDDVQTHLSPASLLAQTGQFTYQAKQKMQCLSMTLFLSPPGWKTSLMQYVECNTVQGVAFAATDLTGGGRKIWSLWMEV